mmetsp:Transcript_106957/g.319842  ORF Transcript_106957/g.319842 Transcript_106957/m.319842 type:complete len:262 (-) Transcript_106957:136-921(-)
MPVPCSSRTLHLRDDWSAADADVREPADASSRRSLHPGLRSQSAVSGPCRGRALAACRAQRQLPPRLPWRPAAPRNCPRAPLERLPWPCKGRLQCWASPRPAPSLPLLTERQTGRCSQPAPLRRLAAPCPWPRTPARRPGGPRAYSSGSTPLKPPWPLWPTQPCPQPRRPRLPARSAPSMSAAAEAPRSSQRAWNLPLRLARGPPPPASAGVARRWLPARPRLSELARRPRSAERTSLPPATEAWGPRPPPPTSSDPGPGL